MNWQDRIKDTIETACIVGLIVVAPVVALGAVIWWDERKRGR